MAPKFKEPKMKRFKLLLIMVLLGGLVSIAYAQETITPEDAAKFIGHQKTVCGTVASVHFAAKVKGQPTFINLDKPYPNQIFTVLIWGSDRSKFEQSPETLYSGKEICVTGMIQSYQGRPEIIVKEPSQIKVKSSQNASSKSY
jgi:micrococcal nuclease